MNCVTWADLFADRAFHTLLLINLCLHVILRETFLLNDRKPLLSVHLQSQCIERAHDDADTTIRALVSSISTGAA